MRRRAPFGMYLKSAKRYGVIAKIRLAYALQPAAALYASTLSAGT